MARETLAEYDLFWSSGY